GQATLTSANLSAGLHSITAVYGGDDNFNGITSELLTVAINNLPEGSCRATPNVLTPPNHKLILIHVDVDPSAVIDGATQFVLTSVTSSEPDEGQGDGDEQNDIQDWEIGKTDT